MKLRNQSQLSLFFFQFSWFLMRTLSLLDTAPPVYFPRKRSSLAHSTLERFKVPLISDRTKTFSFLQVVVESCNTFWLYLKMQNFEVEAKFDFTFWPGPAFWGETHCTTRKTGQWRISAPFFCWPDPAQTAKIAHSVIYI